MKKFINLSSLILVMLVVFLSLTGSSCFRKTGPAGKQKKQTMNTTEKQILTDTSEEVEKFIPVKDYEFIAMTNFMKNHGRSDSNQDYTYLFTDSRGIKHDLITRRLEDIIYEVIIYPSAKTKEQKSVYGYHIEKGKVHSYIKQDQPAFDEMIRVYHEFLYFVEGHNK